MARATKPQQSIAKKGEQYTIAQMIDALKATKGLITVAARKLGCDPGTVYRYIRLYPEVERAKKEEREGFTDIAELSLYNAVQKGEGWAVCFYLKTQGKDRGYVETTRNYNFNLSAEDIAKLSDDELDILYARLTESAAR